PPEERPSSHFVAAAAAEDDDSFISHSVLFGASPDQPADSELEDSASPDSHEFYESKRRNVERSSISRRSLPPTQKEESHDPYSQLPSGRPTSESWSGHAY